jgi:hypothetical protein
MLTRALVVCPLKTSSAAAAESSLPLGRCCHISARPVHGIDNAVARADLTPVDVCAGGAVAAAAVAAAVHAQCNKSTEMLQNSRHINFGRKNKLACPIRIKALARKAQRVRAAKVIRVLLSQATKLRGLDPKPSR